jgi:hypothetical protein
MGHEVQGHISIHQDKDLIQINVEPRYESSSLKNEEVGGVGYKVVFNPDHGSKLH